MDISTTSHHVSLPPKDDPKFLACWVLSENLLPFDFAEFSHYPLEWNTPMILSGPTSRNPVDLNQVRTKVRQLVHLFLSIDQETFKSGTCGQRDWNVQEYHHAWSTVLHEWSVAHWPRNQACMEVCGVWINYHHKYWARCLWRTAVGDGNIACGYSYAHRCWLWKFSIPLVKCASSINITKAGKLGFRPHCCKNHWQNISHTE
jgi:hypothetical protein